MRAQTLRATQPRDYAFAPQLSNAGLDAQRVRGLTRPFLLVALLTHACSQQPPAPAPGDCAQDARACACVDSAGSPGCAELPAENGARSLLDAGRKPTAYDAGIAHAELGAAATDTGMQSASGSGMTMALRPELTPEPVDESSYVFDPRQVRSYNLIIAPADLATIDQNPSAEQYVPASLEFEGKVYGPYRARYKGNGGAFEPPCTLGGATLQAPKMGKCSIKIDFDLDNHATFFGLKKLNFHSMNRDAAMLRERLAYAMFREMQIAAPRAVHARLSINGQLEGLFVAVEQIDSTFARARFGEGGEGNLYKEVWPTYSDASVYVTALENNDKHPHVQRMLDFKQAVDQGADSFASFVDRDYMLRYSAVDRVIVNDDGMFHFWCGAGVQGNNPGEFGNHNYYWYEASAANRLWLIPWDLDLVFEARPDDVVYPQWTQADACVCAYPMYGLQRPASCDPVVQHLKIWLDDYEKKVDDFVAGPFAPNSVDQKLNTWSDQIEAAVGEAAGIYGAPSVQAWKSALLSLRDRIASARSNRGLAY